MHSEALRSIQVRVQMDGLKMRDFERAFVELRELGVPEDASIDYQSPGWCSASWVRDAREHSG